MSQNIKAYNFGAKIQNQVKQFFLPFSTNSFSDTDKLPPPTADEVTTGVLAKPIVDLAPGDRRGLFGDFLLL